MSYAQIIKKLRILAVVLLLLQAYACSDKMEYATTVKHAGPVVQATAEPHFGEAPLDVEFNADGSYIPGGGELKYSWDFDDGSISEGVSTKHTFQTFGTYMVALTVTGANGKKGTDWIVIIVN